MVGLLRTSLEKKSLKSTNTLVMEFVESVATCGPDGETSQLLTRRRIMTATLKKAYGVGLHGSAIAVVAALGMLFGGKTLTAQGGCENDGCSRVCSFGTCTGDCYDDPGSKTACNMNGKDCGETECKDQ
jgi:hypothetical protein